MQRIILTCAMVIFIAAAAWAQPPAQKSDRPMSERDTVLVEVTSGASDHQLVLNVTVVNVDTLASLVMPLMAKAPGVSLAYDSTSFAGGRVEYFQLKSDHQPDSTQPAVLLGLIADMSGTNPPLPPGRGPVARIYFTGDKPIELTKVKVEKIQLPPANQLDYTTPSLVTIRPTLVTRVGKPGMDKGSMGKGSMGK